MARLWEPTRPFSRALVVVAHPDDAEFGAGGTVARLVGMGTDVRYVVVTDGASGSADPAMSRARLIGLREAEQRAACKELGVSDVTFLGYVDGYLEATVPARRAIAAEIRRHRPELVIGMDPTVRWTDWGFINHPDHRAVGDLVLHSINPAASTRLWDTTLIDEGLEPWDVAELWLTSFGQGDTLIDITDTFDRKLAALRAHTSQLSGWDPEPRMRDMSTRLGARVDRPLCEAFTRLTLRHLDDEGSEPVRPKPPTNPRPTRH
ncbi:MAG TPA: PIG-L deacetylase family protein [Euzebyales bacterium]|nr:PIG-L deacetylase family protein [Euzebyales bacterium]